MNTTAAIERWKKNQKLSIVEHESVKVNNHNNNKTKDISVAKDGKEIEAKQVVVQKITLRKQKPQENPKKTCGIINRLANCPVLAGTSRIFMQIRNSQTGCLLSLFLKR